MNMKEYLKTSARTASGEFHKEQVPTALFEDLASQIAIVGAYADEIKKSLFYGRGAGPVTTAKIQNASKAFLERGPKWKKYEPEVVHGVLGVFTEAAELIEALVKNELVDEKAVNEIGDVLWYLAMLMRHFQTDFETVAAENDAKLKRRYPEKFSLEQAIAKADEAGEEVVQDGALTE